jgi:hypothetical protein
MKATDIPNQKRDRGRPVTKIGNKTIYEADMREAKANQQNLVASQLKDMPIPAGKRYTKEQIIELQKDAFRKMQQKQLQKLQQAVDPRTGKPLTQQQIKQRRATSERLAKEFKNKQPFIQKFMKGEIGVRELRGSGFFQPQEIKGIEKGYLFRQFKEGKITDRQLSKSGKFSVREIRDIKRSVRFDRMSPEEKRAYGERQRKERQRLDKMAEDRRTQPQRRRRRIRDAFRRMREDARSRVGRRRRPTPTRGTAPGRYRTRGQQERATGVRIPRRGMRGPR